MIVFYIFCKTSKFHSVKKKKCRCFISQTRVIFKSRDLMEERYYSLSVAPFTFRTRTVDLLKSSKRREIRCIPAHGVNYRKLNFQFGFSFNPAPCTLLSIGPRIRLSTIQVSEYKGLRFVENFRTLTVNRLRYL